MSIVPASKKPNVPFQISQLTKSLPWSQRYLSLDFFVSSVEKRTNKQTNDNNINILQFLCSQNSNLTLTMCLCIVFFSLPVFFLLAYNVGPTYGARNNLARSRFYQ